MGLLSSLFGSSNKTTSQTTTNASQTTNAVNAEGGSTAIDDLYGTYEVNTQYTDNSDNSIRVDNSITDNSDRSVKYDVTDARDLSTSFVDNSDRSVTNTDARQSFDYSVTNDVSKDIVMYMLDVTNQEDARRSEQVTNLSKTITQAGLDYYSQSADMVRDAYGDALAAVTGNTDKTVAAITEASRTDGQQIAATVEKFGKYAVVAVLGLAAFAAMRAA